MSQELHYTSAPRGLRPGSQGYCTVACTAQMPGNLAERLEGLSAYRHVYAPHDPRAAYNPVAYSHLSVMVAGTPIHVVSRIGAAGLDYTDRANKYAHHVALDASELPRGGPAWLLSQPGFLRESWDGHIGYLDQTHAVPVPQGGDRPRACQAWQDATGDAGWAGVLAEAFLTGKNPVVFLVFEPGMNLLPLLAEAEALLPPERRWDVTFNTYFTGVPQGVTCAWRGVVRGSPEALHARRMSQALVLDLDHSLGKPTGGLLVEQARIGRPVPGSTSARGFGSSSPSPPAVPSRSPQVGAIPVTAGYTVIPELPKRGGPRPDRAEQTRARRPQRAGAVIGAVCIFLVVTAGLVARQFAYRARDNVHQILPEQPATEPGNTGSLVNDTAPRGVPGRDSSPTGDDTSRVSPANNGHPQEEVSQARSPTGNNAPVPEAPIASQPSAAEPPPSELTSKAAREPAPSTGKGQGAPVSNRNAKRPDVRDRGGNAARGSSMTWRQLPGPFVTPGGPTEIAQWPQGVAFTMELKGITDKSYEPLGFRTKGRGTEREPLAVVCQTNGEERAIGEFWIKDGSVRFLWDAHLDAACTDQAWALRWCVLSVEPNDDRADAVGIRVLLHGRANVEALKFDPATREVTIRWQATDRPLRRKLWLMNWNSTDRAIKHADAGGTRPDVLEFAVPDPGAFRIRVRLKGPGNTRSFENFRIALEIAPLPGSLQKSMNGALRQLANRPTARDIAAKDVKEFGELLGKRDTAIHTLRANGERKDPLSKLTQLRTALFELEDVAKKIQSIKADNEWFARERKAITEIGEPLSTLERIHKLAADSDGLRFSGSIATEIAGDVIEVARIGTVDDGRADPGAGPTAAGDAK